MTTRTHKIPINDVLQYWVDNYIMGDNMEIEEFFLNAFTCELIVVFKEKDDE